MPALSGWFRFGLRSLVSAAWLAMSMTAHAGDFPDHTLRIIVPFPPGGGTDTIARQLAQRLSIVLKQSVIIANMPGAVGTIGTESVLRAPADGYTISLGISATHAIAPSLFKQLPYDPVKDFVVLGEISTIGNVIAVNPSIPVRNVKELVDWSRRTPGGGAYGSWGIGSGGHLAMEFIKSKTGMTIVHAPYKGAAAALNDLLGNQLQVTTTDVTSSAPFYKAGKIRVIAVTGSKRSPNMPDVPTLVEQGIPFDTDSWYALFVSAKTPAPIVKTLRTAVAQVLAQPDMPKVLNDIGMNPSTLTPEAFAAVQKKDVATWAALVRLSGATID